MKAPKGIYLRGSVYWLAVQKLRKRVFVSLETSDLLVAIQRAAEIRLAPELNEGGLLTSEIDRFLRFKLDRNEFSRQTADNSRQFLHHLPLMLGNVAPLHVSITMAQGFYARLRERMTESSAQTYVAHARSFFKWAVQERLCSTNPFDAIQMPKLIVVARKRTCNAVLRDKLIAEAPRDDLRFVLFCGFHAGMRRNEIVEARPEWFNLDDRLIHLSKLSAQDAANRGLDPFDLKDREERTVPLSKSFTAFLREWLDVDSDYCIGGGIRRGRARYRYDFRRFFEEYMEAQECAWVTAHTMRRTFGSIHATRGTSLLMIATWLGDDYETTRKHYAHLAPAHDIFEKGI